MDLIIFRQWFPVGCFYLCAQLSVSEFRKHTATYLEYSTLLQLIIMSIPALIKRSTNVAMIFLIMHDQHAMCMT